MPNMSHSPKNLTMHRNEKEEMLEAIQKMIGNQTQEINTSIASIKATVDAKFRELGQKMSEMESDNLELKRKNESLEARMLFLEREGRRNNVIISGMKTESVTEGREVFEALVEKSSGAKIQLSNYRIIKSAESSRIVATCSNWEDKMVVMASKKNFKNVDQTPIYVDNDLSKADREVQGKLRACAKECRLRGLAVQVGFRKLRVNGVWKPYDQVMREHMGPSSPPRFFRQEQQNPLLERSGTEKENQRN